MSAVGLPPVSPSTVSVLAPISTWAFRLVAPLGSSAMSANGMMELADRVKYILVVILLAAIVLATKYSHLLGRVTASGASATDPVGATPGKRVDRSGSAAEPERQIIEALSEIERQFNALFSDLKQLNIADGLGDVIERALQEFHQKFDQYNSQNHLMTEFKCFNHVEANFRFLKSMRESLFLAPIRMDDKGIIPQPQDGNCLYHSLGEGLQLLRESLIQCGAWVEESLSHEYLRDKVVTWMTENINADNDLQGYLDRAVGDYIEVRKGQYRDEREGLNALKLMGEDISAASASLEHAERELSQLESLERDQKHQWYLEQAGKLKFFASVAEMYAFSQLYPRVSVHVWRELGGRYTDSFDTPFNQTDLPINLAYNLSGDHFNYYVPGT